MIACGVLSLTAYAVSAAAADEDWRTAAEARIAELRQGDLTIEVVDAAGQPQPGVTVQVAMTRHAFAFGTAVKAAFAAPPLEGGTPSPDRVIYRQKIAELFNTAVLENGHKWRPWENSAKQQDTIAATTWLLDQGLDVRGHTMVWQHKNPKWSVPDAVYHSEDPAYIRQRVADHIREISGQTYGRHGPLRDWDVLNEQWSEHVLTDKLSPDVPKEQAPDLVDWFKLAKESTPPGTRLLINDYGILVGRNTEHQDSYFQTIDFLLKQGAPLHGIGMQSHWTGAQSLVPPEEILTRLDRFAQFGLPIVITEFDMFGGGWAEGQKAEFFRDFLTLCFSHPAVDGFVMWGLWDAIHWQQSAPLFDKDWNLKPEGQVYMDLVFDQWWTPPGTQVTTDDRGRATVRGFRGEYDLTVTTAAGQTINTAALLEGPAAAVQIAIP